MNVLVSGATGMIGSALVASLRAHGHTVRRLVRDGGDEHDVAWRPERGEIDAARLAGFDAVVHLAGESIGEGRWTAEKKARIRDSRNRGTRLLAESLARLPAPPKTLACASAVGFYGDRGDEWLDEQSPLGAGFLAEVCREWEASARPAVEKGIRVANTRFGFVLSQKGGGLARMLPPFRAGLGGKIGTGRQWMSWIELDDVVAAIEHVLATEALRGAVNVVAPEPVTNAEFTKTLARVLGRPAFFAMPAFAARAVFGEVANELLLASQRAAPKKLLASGHHFAFPTLEGALRHTLEKGG
jgi:uncharacterized protein (TIGR01777 family)